MTDKIEAAELAKRLRSLNPWTELDWPEVCRAAADALTSTSSAQPGVKALEWEEVEGGAKLRGVCKDVMSYLILNDATAPASKSFAQADFDQRIRSALVWRPTHRHKKRGSEYQLLGIGKMQTNDWSDLAVYPAQSPVDMREVAIYCAKDGTLWVRPREEFEDGRFEPLRPLHPFQNKEN